MSMNWQPSLFNPVRASHPYPPIPLDCSQGTPTPTHTLVTKSLMIISL